MRSSAVLHARRSAGALLALTLVAGGVSACGSSDSGSGSASSGEKIGISVPLLTTPFWKQYLSTVDATVKADGLDALKPVNANGDAAKQVADINAMLTQGAKGIVLSPVDSGAIVAQLKVLDAKKIPVVFVNDPPASGKAAIVVQADNTAYGADMCNEMSKTVQSGAVVSIQGDQSNVAGRQRAEGFEGCMAEKAPGVTVLKVPTKWDAKSASDGLQTLLSSRQDIKGIAMAAGGAFLPPVMSVLKSKGLLVKAGDPKHVFLASIDGIELEYKAMSDGFEDVVVAQPVDDYAKVGLAYIQDAMAGKTFKEGPTDHGSTIIKDSNGNLLDQLPAKIITPANLSTVYQP